jgi:hypothetical protein
MQEHETKIEEVIEEVGAASELTQAGGTIDFEPNGQPLV